MGLIQRIETFILGLAGIFCGLLIIDSPGEGYGTAAAFLGVMLLFSGLRSLYYYFSMARHMVGGKAILFTGIITLDFGVFTFSLTSLPRIYLILYLLAVHAIAGIVDILRGLESKRLSAPSWRWSIFRGSVNLTAAIMCVGFLRHPFILIRLYSLGLIYSSLLTMVNAFRRTTFVYIP